MEKINALIAVRERNLKEVRERLSSSGFTPEEIDDALETAVRVNLINEERYARAFIRGKVHSGWGRVKNRRPLACKRHWRGDHSVLCRELGSPDDEYRSALLELSKRSTTSKNPYATYMRRLLSRGYSYDLATRVVRDYLSGSTSGS